MLALEAQTARKIMIHAPIVVVQHSQLIIFVGRIMLPN